MLQGTVTKTTEGTHTVNTSGDAATLSTGDRVILSFADGERARITGTIQATRSGPSGGFELEILDGEARHRDKRDFPRLCAGLPIRYQLVTDPDCVKSYVQDGETASAEWHTPDPFMNFSIGGLRFDGLESLSTGQTLLIDLALSEEGQRWATTAKIIRVWPAEEGAANTRPVAVAFEHLPATAREALSELTLRIQESLL